MSYRGRSGAVTAVAIAVIFGVYFAWSSLEVRTVAQSVGSLIATIIVLAVVITAFEIVVAIVHRRVTGEQRADERDALISAKAARNGYFALLGGVWLTPILAVGGAPGLVTANFTLAMIVLAEIVNFGSRAYYDLIGA